MVLPRSKLKISGTAYRQLLLAKSYFLKVPIKKGLGWVLKSFEMYVCVKVNYQSAKLIDYVIPLLQLERDISAIIFLHLF